MALPFEILVLYMSVALIIGIIGIILGLKKIEGSPMITVFAGIMILGVFAISGDSISGLSNESKETPVYTVSHPMNVTTSSTSEAFSTTITAQAERPINVNSVLVGKKINCIEVNMLRTGSPTDNVMIGIGDNDARMVKLFGNITASSINTGTRSYQVCLDSHDYWIIAYNDYIMIKHTGSAPSNFISVSSDATNPFDSNNSGKSKYTSGVWSDTAGHDLRMKLTNEELSLEKESIPYRLNDNDEYVFFIVLGAFFIFLGIMIQFSKW